MSNNQISARIHLLVNSRFQGNWAEFARFVQMNNSTLQNVKDGGNISIITASRISEKLSLSLDWLLAGIDPMYREEQQPWKLTVDANLPPEDLPCEQIVLWQRFIWRQLTPPQKTWFVEQFKRAFPEFEVWLATYNTTSASASSHPDR